MKYFFYPWRWNLGLLAMVIAGCQSLAPAPPLQRFSYAELHMGTIFRIALYAPDQAAADRVAEAAFRQVAALDATMTDYNPNSELMRLCQQPIGMPIQVSRDLFAILKKSEGIAQKTQGAFDVTIGPLVQLWRRAQQSSVLPSPAQISEAHRAVGYQKLRLDHRRQTVTLTAPDMKLDLGGIAKGWAADEALAVLRKMGRPRAMVMAGGDIALGDPPPGRPGWAIGIQSIDHPQQGLTRDVWARNAGISTSGDTEQYLELAGRRYSHIVDPHTGLGLTNRIGVTIIAPNAATSDSLATAVSVMGTQRGLALVESWPRIAALIVTLSGDTKNIIESRRFRHYVRPMDRGPMRRRLNRLGKWTRLTHCGTHCVKLTSKLIECSRRLIRLTNDGCISDFSEGNLC